MSRYYHWSLQGGGLESSIFSSMPYIVANCHNQLLGMRRSLVKLSGVVNELTKMMTGCLRATKVTILA